MTEKLYYKDGYIKEFEAIITNCIKKDDYFIIELDKTAFYPEGGGQAGDTGFIGDIEVFDTHEKDEKVLHYSKNSIEIGAFVKCCINWERRFPIMQEHTGEHIVSGVIHKLYGYNNVGFHMGKDAVVIDIDGNLNESDIDKIEYISNEAIYENIEVQTSIYDEKTFSNIEYRSKKKIEGNIQIVNIEGYDTCACCGVHTKRTGEIGIIKILDFQKYKGGTRISMLCGKRALIDYRNKNKDVYKISSILSAKPENITEYTETTLKNLEYEKNENFRLNMEFFKLKSEKYNNEKFIIEFLEIENSDLLRRYCTILSEKSDMCCVFGGNDQKGYKYVVYSKYENMKEFAKNMNKELSGKGGGKDLMIQGSISATKENIEKYFNKYK